VKVTYCQECEHVERTSRKSNPHYWLCTKFPRAEGMGFVAPNYWAEHEPFMRCTNINGGLCPLWKPIRTPQMELEVEPD
jgi:hypothetical protein